SSLEDGFDAAAGLPGAVANYTTRRSKQLRQIAVEVHSAAAKDPTVRRFLRRSLDLQIGQIGDSIAAGQQAGDLDPDPAPEFMASMIFVFIMGLMHMETLLPNLVGDEAWRVFVAGRVAKLLGAAEPGAGLPTA
ncbi:MAG: hypothetical protein ACREEQ_10620, partial [Caulobacteraceae bacterium]